MTADERWADALDELEALHVAVFGKAWTNGPTPADRQRIADALAAADRRHRQASK